MVNDREEFFKEISKLIEDGVLSDAAARYFEELKNPPKEAAECTETGRKILDFMTENVDKYHNKFRAKDIAEGLFMPPKSVSGSMRKLVTDGFCCKEGKDPVYYSLN